MAKLIRIGLLGVALNFLQPGGTAYDYEYYYANRSRSDTVSGRAGT